MYILNLGHRECHFIDMEAFEEKYFERDGIHLNNEGQLKLLTYLKQELQITEELDPELVEEPLDAIA